MDSTVWIPAFAGITGVENGNDEAREREWLEKSGMMARQPNVIRFAGLCDSE